MFNRTYSGRISEHATTDLTKYGQDVAAAMYIIDAQAREQGTDYVTQRWAREQGINRSLVKTMRGFKLLTEEFNNAPILHLSLWPVENDEHKQTVMGAWRARRAAAADRPNPMKRS